MTLAEKEYGKTEREVKSMAVDAGGVLASGETVAAVSAIVHQSVSGGDEISFSGLTPNAAAIVEPGFRPIPVGEGIQFFAGGGKSSVAAYQCVARIVTSGGQNLDLEFVINVKKDHATA